MRRMEEFGPTIDFISLTKQWALIIMRMSYLNLQQVIPTDALVVHLVVGVIRITTTLILNEGKPTFSVNDIRVDSYGDRDLAHRRLAAVRGAGMSQRTRRP
jgi:hypothetical protein